MRARQVYNLSMPVKRSSARLAPSVHSDSTEDHLERIAELVEHKGYARVTDVAEQLNLTPATVSNMVRRLAARGFLNYEKYRGFSLTAEGRAVASRIKARHEILTELFGLMGLEPDMLRQEVEDIEHHLRPQTLELLAKLVSYWRTHPKDLQAFLRYSNEKNS
jgi:Mn-dependent DtxR family transcriptional regulator